MYFIFLFLHSWFRWIVVVLMILTLALSCRNWVLKRPFTPGVGKLFHFFRLSFAIQVLLGLLLYFIFSPLTTNYLYHDIKHLASRPQSVFTVMHPIAMIIATLVAKAGAQRADRATEATVKYRMWFIYTLVVLVLVIIAVPWPFYEVGRPLYR